MSVTGEFLRAVGGCIELLEGAGSGLAPWEGRLHAARAIAARDLSTAAERVLGLDAGRDRISKLDLPTASQTAQFRERCEKMLAVARVIVGAPRV